MYRVVLGIDRDENRAMAQAEMVANLPNAAEEVEAILLHDFTDNPTGASVTQVASVRHANEYLKERGIKTELRESSGDPAREIIELAEEVDADAICVAGRKRTPAGKVLFGSVTQAVILSTDIPVIVCSAKEE